MEITANALQTVLENQNVVFTDNVVCGSASIMHRNGSGLISLRGLTNQCRARFRISFGANVAVPTEGTVGEISAAITVEGEPITSTTMIVTPGTTGAFFNISTDVYIDVPRGCCITIGVKNTSNQSILVQNANLIAERVA